MKFKYLLLSFMLLLLIGSAAAVAAADDYESLGDYTFDIPDGYQVADKDDSTLAMEADDDHSVIVCLLDSASDADIFKGALEKVGCEFGDVESSEVGNFNVDQCTYKFEDTQGYLYVCNDGGKPIIVASGIPNTEELPAADDNPAYQVVSSLE